MKGLNSPEMLWCYRAGMESCLKQYIIATSHTQIEGFWQLYNNTITPAEMEQNSNFHFFKSGIKPLWEHPANLDGGKWVLTIKNDTTSLTKSWLEVVSLTVTLQLPVCNELVSIFCCSYCS